MNMRGWVVGCVCVAVAAVAWFGGRLYAQQKETKGEAMIAHMVYFTLKDKSPEAQAKMVAACDKYLSDHPGTVFYCAGTLAQELDRPVNVRDFQIGLHVVFKDQAAHDAYQTAPKHVQFIEENKANWESVRVFDSKCNAPAK